MRTISMNTASMAEQSMDRRCRWLGPRRRGDRVRPCAVDVEASPILAHSAARGAACEHQQQRRGRCRLEVSSARAAPANALERAGRNAGSRHASRYHRQLCRGINDAGDIVGQSWSQSGGRAFLWTSAGGMVDIGPFSSFGSAAALGINSGRTVIGNGTTTAGSQRAFIWTPGGEMQDLGTLGGNSSGANDINDAGQVVGGASPLSGGYHAFVWTASGGMIDLDPLGGNSVANRINNRGEIVGYRVISTGIRAFLWTPAGGMVDLGEGQATGLNDVGQVVGESGRPFVWTSSGGRMPLPEIGPLHSTVARDINNPGLAVGYGALAIGAWHCPPVV